MSTRIDRRTLLSASFALPFAVGQSSGSGRRESCEPVRFVRLTCGRRLAYAEYGDPRGTTTLIYNHGLPSCRLEAETYLDALRGFPGVRLIAIDRPGIGRSDDNEALNFLTWPADVAAIADALGIDRFGLVGTSGGTAYTLAIARALPTRVTAVSLVEPLAPFPVLEAAGGASVDAARLAVRRPRLVGIGLNTKARRTGRGHDPLPDSYLAPADHAVLDSPGGREFVARVVDEALVNGAAGTVRDIARMLTPWGHWLKDVTPRVTLIHGCADRMAPPACSRYLAEQLPNVEARFIPGEGHLSTPRNHAAAVLAAALR